MIHEDLKTKIKEIPDPKLNEFLEFVWMNERENPDYLQFKKIFLQKLDRLTQE